MPDNSIVCSVLGHGITSLAGGDYDGDILCVSANESLVDFVKRTERGLDELPLVGKVDIPQKTPTPMGAEKVQQYLAYAANTETPNVRGTATFYAEQAQDAAKPSLLL